MKFEEAVRDVVRFEEAVRLHIVAKEPGERAKTLLPDVVPF